MRRALSQEKLQALLEEYIWMESNWRLLKSVAGAVRMNIWFDSGPTVKNSCGAVGCLGGWTSHLARKDSYIVLQPFALARHFAAKDNEDASFHFNNLFDGRSTCKVSEWKEGHDRLTKAINYIKKEIQ